MSNRGSGRKLNSNMMQSYDDNYRRQNNSHGSSEQSHNGLRLPQINNQQNSRNGDFQ